jgi:hypothetical protein
MSVTVVHPGLFRSSHRTAMDNWGFVPDNGTLMSNPKKRGLSDALSRDLRKPGAKELVKVLDDVARKVFTAHKDGAVFEFGHKQPDPAFWKGVKHYGSGPSSRVRFRRTPEATPEPAAE